MASLLRAIKGNNWPFRKVAVQSYGVIVDVRYVSHGKGGAWHPVLRFDTADGRRVDAQAKHGSRLRQPRRGDEVAILYDPADPTRADLAGRLGGRPTEESGPSWTAHLYNPPVPHPGRPAPNDRTPAGTYVVRRISRWMALMPTFIILTLLVRIVIHTPRTVPLFDVAALAALVVHALVSGRVLRVDGRGITLGNKWAPRSPMVHVPWTSVREVVVSTGSATGPQVGVHLWPGAPLPTGLQGMIQDPADPDRLQPSLVRSIPRLDRATSTQRCTPTASPSLTRQNRVSPPAAGTASKARRPQQDRDGNPIPPAAQASATGTARRGRHTLQAAGPSTVGQPEASPRHRPPKGRGGSPAFKGGEAFCSSYSP